MKSLSGEDFDSYGDFEDWLVENYVMVFRTIATQEGKDPDAAERKAKGELPKFKAKIAARRRKVEQAAARNAKRKAKKKD